VFNLENKALRPIEILLSTNNVDTDILMRILSIRWRVTKQTKWLKLKNDATPGVQAKYICSKRYTKENEVNHKLNSSVQKRAILKRPYPEEDFTSTAKTNILSKMADRLR
jgi:hypothetical protein